MIFRWRGNRRHLSTRSRSRWARDRPPWPARPSLTRVSRSWSKAGQVKTVVRRSRIGW